MNLSFANNPAESKNSCRDTFITMVKATEFRNFNDRAMLHNRTFDRALLLERKIGTRLMVMAEVGG